MVRTSSNTTLNEGAQYYTVEGRTIGTALEEGRRTPILVRGSEMTREAPTLLASLPLTLTSGQHVALSQVARIQRVDGPVKIDREDGNRMSVGSRQRPGPRYGRLCRSGAAEGCD
jgi:Cu/Ag efflux pump CusA